MNFGKESVLMTCPNCRALIRRSTVSEPSDKTKQSALIFLCLFLSGLCLPFCFEVS